MDDLSFLEQCGENDNEAAVSWLKGRNQFLNVAMVLVWNFGDVGKWILLLKV